MKSWNLSTDFAQFFQNTVDFPRAGINNSCEYFRVASWIGRVEVHFYFGYRDYHHNDAAVNTSVAAIVDYHV